MAKIVDPDQLNQATEVDFTPASKTITLNVAGNLDDTAPGRASGVAHQALYSFAKEEWLADSTLQANRFPFLALFEAKFDWINEWQPADAQTRDLIRDGGFRVVTLNDEYAGIISLQSFEDSSSDLAYYWQVDGSSQQASTETVTSFDKTGEINEPILIFDGTADYRSFLKVALRTRAKTYGFGNLLIDQDLSALTYQAYRIPISNAVDVNVTATDADIDSTTPYTNMRISYLKGTGFDNWSSNTVYSSGAVVLDSTRQSSGSANGTWWFTPAGGTSSTLAGAGTGGDTGVTDWEVYTGQEQIGAEFFAFNRVVDLSTGTATSSQFYEFAQRQLRQTGDINSSASTATNQNSFGEVHGDVAMELFSFIGNTLRSKPGVLLRDFDPNNTNQLELSDITVSTQGLDLDAVPNVTTIRTFPFVSAGNMQFSANLVGDTDSNTLYKMFFQRTTRDSDANLAMESVATSSGTIASRGALDLTVNFSSGDYVQISGFASTNNNGLYQISTVTAVVSTSMNVRRVNGSSLTTEAVGATVNLDNDPYDSPDAIIVNDNGGTPITGQITASSISFDFDYDGNVQGGRSSGTDAPVAIIAQGTTGAQWVDGLFTITRATGLTFPVNAADERVYSNP